MLRRSKKKILSPFDLRVVTGSGVVDSAMMYVYIEQKEERFQPSIARAVKIPMYSQQATIVAYGIQRRRPSSGF